MDNDNKIKEIFDAREKDNTELTATSLFLKDNSKFKKDKKEIYNLEDEFYSAKKNKNIVYKISFALLIIFMLTASIGGVYFIRSKTRKTTVGIEEFKDVILQEILNSAWQDENKLTLLTTEYEEIINQKEFEIEKIKFDIRRQRSIILERNMKKDVERKLIRKLALEEKEEVNKIEEKYKDQISEKENEIIEIKKKLDEIDKKKKQEGIEGDEVVDNQKKIQELQLSKIISFYEEKIKRDMDYNKERIKNTEQYYNDLIKVIRLKYNPVFKDEEIKEILKKTLTDKINFKNDYTASEEKIKNEILYYLTEKKIADNDKLDGIIENVENREKIVKSLKNIPFENSVPQLITRLDEYDKYLYYEYREMLYKSVSELTYLLNQKDQEISSKDSIILDQKNIIDETGKNLNNYINAIEAGIDKSPTPGKIYAGYILDLSDRNDIGFKLDPGIKLKDYQIGYIVGGNKIMNKIVFYSEDNKLKARIIQADEIKSLPLHKILLSEKEEFYNE